MADDEILRRIDEHLAETRELNARAEDVHERNRVAFEGMMDALSRFREELSIEFQRNREAFDRNTAAFDRNTDVHRDLRQFIREILQRNELAMNRLIEKIDNRLPPATP